MFSASATATPPSCTNHPSPVISAAIVATADRRIPVPARTIMSSPRPYADWTLGRAALGTAQTRLSLYRAAWVTPRAP